MKAAAIFQSAEQNILRDAEITSTVTPSSGYSLETLGYLRPDMRVVWPAGHVVIRFTHPGSPAVARQGDIFVLPMHNLAQGSPGSLVLTNDVGLTQELTIPAALGNGLPRTLVIDLTIDTPLAATRTATYWELDLDNADALVLGGAVAIYGPKTYLLDRDFQFGYSFKKHGYFLDAVNDYGTRFRQNLETMTRSVDLSTIATSDDADALEAWFEANNGAAKPGLLWFDPNVQDAFLGYLQPDFVRTYAFAEAEAIGITFDELSKGRPIA